MVAVVGSVMSVASIGANVLALSELFPESVHGCERVAVAPMVAVAAL